MFQKISMLLLILSVFFVPVDARTPKITCALGGSADSYDIYADQRPTGDAMELARRVSAAVISVCSPNCSSLTLYRNPSIAGAALFAYPDRPKMVYSPQFFTAVYEKYGDGGIMAIVAHMLGHVIDAAAPAKWIIVSWTPELRADAWTGCALANAGLSQPGLQSALQSVAAYPSSSHPNWAMRVSALRHGYTQCGGDAARFDKALKAASN